MMMIDIDCFKAVNDTYGHPKGDEILKAIAEVLSARFRGTDLVARYGGEEFSAFLPNISEQSAMELAEQLRERSQKLEFSAESSTFRITVSIGLAIFNPASHLSFERLLADADAALYAAKKWGKRLAEGKGHIRFLLPHEELQLEKPQKSKGMER